MLSQYIQAAMRQAKYKVLPDDGSYYCEIPEFQGVYTNAEMLGACRNELQEVLEKWIIFRLSKKLPLPTVNDLNLSVEKVS